jgi:hypothetical protein
MIHQFDLCDLRDALDAKLGWANGPSDEVIDQCRANAIDMAGRIAGFAEEAAALFFELCRECGNTDFAVVVVKRIVANHGAAFSAAAARELLLIADDIYSSGKEYDEVLRWFESQFRPKRTSM